MPIHDLGYRNWEGERSSNSVRWWVIAQTGVRLAWKSSWLRRMLFFAWLPTLFWAVAVFLYEQALKQSPDSLEFVVGVLEAFDAQRGEFTDLIAELKTDPAAARHQVWATLLMIFFRTPQALLMVLVVGMIAPSLIAQDVRSRAFLVYFSRPLTPWEYALGKSSIVWAYLMMITCLPALLLYTMALLLSPELSLISFTWDLPARIIGASIVLLIPTTAVALCLSSLTSESRYAGFAWFAIWVIGWVTYSILATRDAAANMADGGEFEFAADRWTLFSPYETLGEVQSWVFGLEDSFADVMPEAIALSVVTAVSLAILLRRVSAPMRV